MGEPTSEVINQPEQGINYKNVHLDLQSGDITQIQSNSLIALINSTQEWYGGLDRAIQQISGNDFHQVASDYLENHPEATDGSAIFADGAYVAGERNRRFNNVIFVIDDLHLPVDKLVEAGLVEAKRKQQQVVTMPFMRTGVMVGAVEKTIEEVAEGMITGIKTSADNDSNVPLTVKIVVYGDEDGTKHSVLKAAGEKILKPVKEVEERAESAVLISGFPGVGKSTLFNNSGEHIFLDSDSSNFSWSNKEKRERDPDWPQNYLEYIEANKHKADGIFISSHKEVRDALAKAGKRFTLVYPSLEMKDEYIERYIARGNDPQFVDLLKANYDTWIQELMAQEGCKHVVLQPGQYLSDVIGNIVVNPSRENGNNIVEQNK